MIDLRDLNFNGNGNIRLVLDTHSQRVESDMCQLLLYFQQLCKSVSIHVGPLRRRTQMKERWINKNNYNVVLRDCSCYPSEQIYRIKRKDNCLMCCYISDNHRHWGSAKDAILTQARKYDLVFIAQGAYISDYKDMPNVFWVPHTSPWKTPIHSFYEYDISYIVKNRAKPRKRNLLWQKIIENKNRSCLGGQVLNKDRMMKIYSQSKIVFNGSVGNDLNKRAFESLHSGSLLLTDNGIDGEGNGIHQYFEPEKHYIEYDCVGDENEIIEENAIDLISYYLSHDTERNRIARTGHEEYLKHHTPQRRAEQIMALIEKYL